MPKLIRTKTRDVWFFRLYQDNEGARIRVAIYPTGGRKGKIRKFYLWRPFGWLFTRFVEV